MTSYTTMDSPVGRLRLVADEAGLRRLEFQKDGFAEAPEGWREDARTLREASSQLSAYFAGKLTVFDLPLAPEGTPFQLQVWERLLEIPYGETVSYGTLAQRVGNPAASRAVGLANGRNPIAIVIPCHRVIGSNGTLTGYGGGLPNKQKLLALERGQIRLVG
jgi:methylated-DNA-[protein]-cysteine S-methyltransferase